MGDGVKYDQWADEKFLDLAGWSQKDGLDFPNLDAITSDVQ